MRQILSAETPEWEGERKQKASKRMAIDAERREAAETVQREEAVSQANGGRGEGRGEEGATSSGDEVQRENRNTAMVVDDGRRRGRRERANECEARTTGATATTGREGVRTAHARGSAIGARRGGRLLHCVWARARGGRPQRSSAQGAGARAERGQSEQQRPTKGAIRAFNRFVSLLTALLATLTLTCEEVQCGLSSSS